MSGREDSYSPIKDSDLDPFVKEANGLLARIRWRPDLTREERIKFAQQGWPDAVLSPNQVESPIPDDFRVLDGDALVMSPTTNTVLQVLRDGVALGLYVQSDVAKRIGLETMEQADNLAGKGMSTEVRYRKTLLSAIQLYTLSYYVLWHLRDFQEDSRVAMSKPFPGIVEVDHNHTHGVQASVYRSVLHYYAQLIRPQNELVGSRDELVDATVRYFQEVMDHVKNYIIPGLNDGKLFEEIRYSLEGSGFTISGFDEDYANLKTETVELKKVLFTDIIGNHVAKARLSRAVKLMFLRDKVSGENPAMRFGSIPSVFLAQGKPGAGKTLLASAVGTLALQLSEQTGLKVKVMIYPRNIVSKYQGVSSDKAIAFWKQTTDPEYITIVIMDEAEQLIPDRDDDRVSSGAKAGTNAFLVATEGADAIDRGQRLIFLATNHAHLCDSAARSRAKEKVEVNGAETPNDYMDFINLMLRLQDEAFRTVLTLEAPTSYTFMADQKNPPSPDSIKDDTPVVLGLENIRAMVGERFSTGQYDYYGQLFYQFQRANPGFSLRDLRNIIEATIFDMAQFDIPESFFDPEAPDYHPLDLQGKEQELRKRLDAHLRENKVNFAEVFLRNALRQMGEIEKVEQIEHDREVERTVKQLRVHQDARRKAVAHGIDVS